MPNEVYFRAGIGALVTNGDRLVLVAERSDVRDAWQCPQGGLQRGEEPRDALRRELAEETGIRWSDVAVIDEHSDWLAYELPPEARSEKTGRGQVQKWFLLQYQGADEDINVSGAKESEFERWKWVSMEDLINHAWQVKRPIYENLARRWAEFL
jgi:putative (di)nucleoside polyphosphate hydrolase